MNDKEQKTADALLEKLQKSEPNESVQIAQAYQCLSQGALCRKQAEATGK